MELTFIAILLLAAAWAALLLPDVRSRRGAGRRRNSIESFNRQLSTLQRTHRPPTGERALSMAPREAQGAGAGQPAPAVPRGLAPRSTHQARQRRMVVLAGLAAGAVVSLVAAVALHPVLWLVHLAVDAALAAYIRLLVERRNRQEERHAKLRMLHEAPRRMPVRAADARRRSAAGG